MNADEILKDIVELQGFRAASTRPNVSSLLDEKIAELQKKHKNESSIVQISKTISNDLLATTVTGPTSLPTTKLTTYAWDQSEKYVKIYLTLNGVQDLNSSNITHNFSHSDFDVFVSDLNGKNYSMAIKDLLEEIVPDASLIKQKTDSLLVMMKKKKEGKNWEVLTRTEYLEKQKKKPKFDESKVEDPQASLMNMMKQMYDEGDDEIKRSIRKAWHESKKTDKQNFDM